MHRPRALRLLTPIVLTLVLLLGTPAGAAPKKDSPASGGGGGGGGCNPRKSTCTTDSSAPTVHIASPDDGATVAVQLQLEGTASDDRDLASVDVRLDDGAWQRASGTSNWSATVDLAPATGSTVTITARATDAAGNTATTSVNVEVGSGADVQAPSITIEGPTDGATVSGSVTVSGTAHDDLELATVHVQVDGGAATAASGTSSWSVPIDTTAVADGAHVVTATATDASGNATSTSIAIDVANGGAPAGTDWIIDDPQASHSLLPLGRTRLAQWGQVTGVLYTEQFSNRRAIAFRHAGTGATSYVDLPTETLAGWTGAATVMTSAEDLWVFGGNGPMHVRHYRLVGSPLPTAADLVESRVLGDGDSREGDMIALASGGLVLAWHQHGSSGPQGQHVTYRSPSGQWQDLPALTFMPTKSSDQVLGQHPADGSIWLFSNPDAWGAIGAAHLTEANGSLRVDWTDSTYLNTNEHGLHGPDPENPDLALAVDPIGGTMSLAYQSADRQRFTVGSSSAIASRVAVASIGTDGVTGFVVAPVWAERVSDLGLITGDGAVIVTHRPLDPETLTYTDAHAIRHTGGTWETPVLVGTVAGTTPVTYATGRPEVSTRLTDGRIHLRTL